MTQNDMNYVLQSKRDQLLAEILTHPFKEMLRKLIIMSYYTVFS